MQNVKTFIKYQPLIIKQKFQMKVVFSITSVFLMIWEVSEEASIYRTLVYSAFFVIVTIQLRHLYRDCDVGI